MEVTTQFVHAQDQTYIPPHYTDGRLALQNYKYEASKPRYKPRYIIMKIGQVGTKDIYGKIAISLPYLKRKRILTKKMYNRHLYQNTGGTTSTSGKMEPGTWLGRHLHSPDIVWLQSMRFLVLVIVFKVEGEEAEVNE